MHYFEVAVASQTYHGSDPLTYSYSDDLAMGTLVEVPLQRKSVLGFVVSKTSKPTFRLKPISKVYPELPPLPQSQLDLFQWMRQYYPAPLGVTAQLFLPKDLVKIAEPLEATSLASVELPPLTADQRTAIDALMQPGTFLLHGETGSGKTRVYIEAVRRTLSSGKSSIVLTPEISLTSQLTKSFQQAFPGQPIIIFHSQLGPAERRKLWLQALRATSPLIVIGPRSALFSPLPHIGFIAVDEAHEFAYKQENAPHYHASLVASRLGQLQGATVVIGSATPPVTDYFIAEHKQTPILRMTQLAATTDVVPVHTSVVDMRDTAMTARDRHLSQPLLGAIEHALTKKQQVLLFINRRGTARITLCENCGWQALCPHCDLALTYHHDTYLLRCHTCGFSQTALSSCPECGHADITLKSIGTKSIESSVKRYFPGARVARFDSDNKKGERVNELFEEINSGEIDILIGTQLLAKGLDLPQLSLVGVINADASLHIPDFTAQERTYQLLYQLIGRVGRGHQADATVVIQTYSPDNPTINAAVERQWRPFYETELREREQFLFPPYCFLMKATCKRATYESALKTAEKVIAELRKSGLRLVIDGPAPAFHEKVGGKFICQIVLKSKQRTHLVQAARMLPGDWSYDIDPIDLL